MVINISGKNQMIPLSLTKANVPLLKTDEGSSGPCSKPKCAICKHICQNINFNHFPQSANIPSDHRI